MRKMHEMRGSVKNPYKTIRTVLKRNTRLEYVSFKRKPQNEIKIK